MMMAGRAGPTAIAGWIGLRLTSRKKQRHAQCEQECGDEAFCVFGFHILWTPGLAGKTVPASTQLLNRPQRRISFPM